jgi:hypothetical protein
MRSGNVVDLASPDPAAIHVRDIAYALSNQCRFAGSVSRFWSVAGHGLYCRKVGIAAGYPDLKIGFQLHDAHEAFFGDITTPAARAMGAGAGLSHMKDTADEAIAAALGFPVALLRDPVIKEVDRLVLFLEAHYFQRNRGQTLMVELPSAFDVRDFLHLRPPTAGRFRWTARRAFLTTYHRDLKELNR